MGLARTRRVASLLVNRKKYIPHQPLMSEEDYSVSSDNGFVEEIDDESDFD